MRRLIVFSGLPGVGKTSLARALAAQTGAVHLRIDTIETALASAPEIGPGTDQRDWGYRVAYALARDHLAAGHDVIADSVNPIALTRHAWAGVARDRCAALIEIGLLCSDTAEHRRRAEGRMADLAGQVLPRWEQIVARRVEPFDAGSIVFDTAGETLAQSLARLSVAIDAHDGR